MMKRFALLLAALFVASVKSGFFCSFLQARSPP